MASFCLTSPLPVSHLQRLEAWKRQPWRLSRVKLSSARATAGKEDGGAAEVSKPARRGWKKVEKPSAATSSRSRKKKTKEGEIRATKEEEEEEEEDWEFDDGMDFPYEWPPLVCCFGAAQREFIPTVRVSDRRMHPDQYSSWKGLQWNPPEFVRAPGGPPSNVAIALSRLGGRAAFVGKVGDDDYGRDLLLQMNLEKVQTRAVKIDSSARTAISRMKIKFSDSDGRMIAETAADCAEDSLEKSELNLSVLKEARIFHFNSAALMAPATRAALFRAIKLTKKFGGRVFFDVNLPLQLWKSREETWEAIREAWGQADVVELTKQELEFLLDEELYERRRNYQPQYFSESLEQTKNRRDYYHYTREEIAPLWHEGMKILFVTDGTMRVHYYRRGGNDEEDDDGVVVGTEDALITPFTCDRTGSGDALVAGLLRKLAAEEAMWEEKEALERHVRFAIAAGIISQWTIGAVRGFPTERATQNLKEQVYVPSMW